MAVYKIHEAKTHFSKLIEKAMRGEEVVIAKGNQPLVRLSPLPPAQKRKVGSATGLVTMAPDVDDPLPDFSDYQ